MSRRFASLLRIILGPRGRCVLCWLAALTITGAHYFVARQIFGPWHDEGYRRADGNIGHTLVDFGGQWLMARMIAAGHGRELYSRRIQWEELAAAYPRADEFPGQNPGDAQRLFDWMTDLPDEGPGRPRVGGALYPPTHALLFAPLGRLSPREAYNLMQILSLALTWLAGAALAGIARGRLWWPAATAFLMLFSGYQGALGLAQNSMLSLAILTVGWFFVARGWEFTGGVAWGLLAYKPVWAAAFILVPLLTRRWRMLAGMIGAGVLFVLVTLPVVGVQPWLDWLRIGREAAHGYDVIENWVFLSRDLIGIPRRWLVEFRDELAVHDRTAAAVLGWALWLTVVSITVAVAIVRRDAVRSVDGYGAAFVTLGAWASCLHFIYYDLMLAALPVGLLLTDPRRFLRPIVLAAGPSPPEWDDYFAPRPLQSVPTESATITVGSRSAAVLNSMVLTVVALLVVIEQTFNNTDVNATVSIGLLPTGGPIPNVFRFSTHQRGTPWETFVLLALWAYCGARVLMTGSAKRP